MGMQLDKMRANLATLQAQQKREEEEKRRKEKRKTVKTFASVPASKYARRVSRPTTGIFIDL